MTDGDVGLAVACLRCGAINAFESDRSKAAPLIIKRQNCIRCERPMEVWVRSDEALSPGAVVPEPTFKVPDWSVEREIERLRREDPTICNDCGNTSAKNHQCEDCWCADMERLP